MQPEALSEARDWLNRAYRDLRTIERVLAGDDPLTDIAVYHAQQAAEKALKGFLAASNRPFPKTHDLVPLLLECQTLVPEFVRFSAAAQVLTPYASSFRYPGGPIEPAAAEAEEAHRLATEVFVFVEQQIASS